MDILAQSPSLRFRTDSPQQTLEFGQSVASLVHEGFVMALTGELGTGKTLFTKGVGKGLGISQDRITSPTFTLIHEYPARIPLIHVDLYRLESRIDVESLGLSEYFDSDYVVVIEWADRLGRALPPDRLNLHFVYGDDEGTRWIMLNGTGPKSREVETRLRASLSEDRSGAVNPRSPEGGMGGEDSGPQGR